VRIVTDFFGRLGRRTAFLDEGISALDSTVKLASR
jgi:hypothetical protein